MNLSIKWAKPLLLVALTWLLAAPGFVAAQTVIRIAVPDISAGPKPAGGGVVDVIYVNKLLDKAFAKDGVEVRWTFFKGAGPAINEALADPKIQQQFAALGSTTRTSSPTEFGAIIASETEKWAKVIRFAHIKTE